jgi:type VI secretion system protein ImpC
MTESIQKKLLRVRPPRVRITYDVETGGAIEKRELPFIVGILAELSGDVASNKPLPPLKERKLKEIDRDNFNDIMKSIGPRVDLAHAFKQDALKQNVLRDLRTSSDPDDKQIVFGSLDDFDPLRVIFALPTLGAKYRARSQIRGLQAKAESNDTIADYVDKWVGADVAVDVSSLQTELLIALNGAAPDSTARPALRKALADLQDKLQARATADAKVAAADQPSDEDKTAAAGAVTAAVAELKKWALLSADATIDVAKPADAKALDAASANGLMLAGALAAADTPENRTRATKLLQALADEGTESATSTDDDKARYKLRDGAKARLGAANVTGMLTQAGTPAMTAPADDPSWARALLLLGLTEEDDPGVLKKSDYADPKEYQDAYNAAECRSCVMSFSAYLTKADNANRAKVVADVFPVLSMLRNDDSGAAAAIALSRLRYFAAQILAGVQGQSASLLKVLKKGAAAVIDEQVALIDQYLSKALSAVMHSESFKTVEQTWRGLAYLVMNTETGEMLKLRLLNVGKEELRKDMEKAVEFDQSALFKMIYEAEYDTLGGNPYSLLVGGYEIGGGNDDINFLKKISEVAAAAHAPFVAAADSGLFGLSGFDALDKPRDLKKIFEGEELTGWREFREMEDARYVSLVLPRVLLRLPYGRPEKRNTIQCEGLNFEEQVGDGDAGPVFGPNGDPVSYPSPSNENFLWGNAAYVLAERITNAFSLYRWTAAIRGVEGGGLVEGLPIYTYTSETGTAELLCPTEIAITDRREKELNDLGFISLCHNKGSGKAAFFGGQTTNLPKKYFSDAANANARISSMLPYILAASRFAHYIKVIMRDKIGSFLTRANVENYLNTWIANYVLLDDNAAQEVKASYPLRAASVVVTDIPGQPGAYRATAFIKPHFQLEELTTSIRLVAELPS